MPLLPLPLPLPHHIVTSSALHHPFSQSAHTELHLKVIISDSSFSLLTIRNSISHNATLLGHLPQASFLLLLLLIPPFVWIIQPSSHVLVASAHTCKNPQFAYTSLLLLNLKRPLLLDPSYSCRSSTGSHPFSVAIHLHTLARTYTLPIHSTPSPVLQPWSITINQGLAVVFSWLPPCTWSGLKACV